MITVHSVNEMLKKSWPAQNGQCLEVDSTQALVTLTVREQMLRPGGYVAGPTQFATADLALWCLVFGVMERFEPMALTSELSIRFLRPAIGTTLFARAHLERAGRRNVVGTVRVWVDQDEYQPTATAQGTYVLPVDR